MGNWRTSVMFGERPSNVFVLCLWRTSVSSSVNERTNTVMSGVKMSPIVQLYPQTVMQSAIAGVWNYFSDFVNGARKTSIIRMPAANALLEQKYKCATEMIFKK
jgi:hypothetical protein